MTKSRVVNAGTALPSVRGLDAATRGLDAGAGAPGGELTSLVLVLDDEEQVRKTTARMLVDAGYECALAATAAEAWDLLNTRDFDLLICDVQLPGESSLDLIASLHQQSGIAILMMSGQDDPTIAGLTIEHGAHGYLVKPFERGRLLVNVRNTLQRRSLEIQSRDYQAKLEAAVEERTRELAETVASLESSRRETIHRLSRALELRNPETGNHVERIAEISAFLADRMGLDRDRVERLRIASPMHDIGKIGIPDEILIKPGKFTPGERQIMQEHTVIGHRILAGSDSTMLDLAATIALTHHEQFDGGGYPLGLGGDQIPLEGRLVAIADVFDALTHNRVYRPAYPLDDALEIMRGGRGTQFDPELLDIALDSTDALAAINEAGGTPDTFSNPNQLRLGNA